LARRLIGTDEAAEVTQDVFVRAWTKLGTYRGEAAFGTWLHRLAINVMLGRRGQMGLERERYRDVDALDSLAARPVGPEFAVDFQAAITKLPHGARQVFVLHDVEGFKHEEIAGMLGIAAGTSKAQLHRARMALRRHLDR
jgi:RNA polymerase sigma-70 factor (ECF subfamily)